MIIYCVPALERNDRPDNSREHKSGKSCIDYYYHQQKIILRFTIYYNIKLFYSFLYLPSIFPGTRCGYD